MGDFGIVVSGGPAPGINSVIASVVIQAWYKGYRTKGFRKGFKGIILDRQESVMDLSIDQVIPIANLGGSILGTSRYSPFFDKTSEEAFFKVLADNDIDKLVVIGGEGTAYICNRLTQVKPLLKVVHIPKAIDNDLILPNKHPSFGFETARSKGTQILSSLIAEARTTDRWFLVRTMGRKSGFLALGLGIASGATLTLIAEQYRDGITPQDVAEAIFLSVKKRLQNNQRYGTVVLAEGIIDRFDPKKVPELANTPRDEVGRLSFSEVKLEDLVAKSLREMCNEAGLKVRFKTENLGYALRSCEPISFDIEYTRLLGYGAVKYLLEGVGGVTVVRDFDNLAYVPLSAFVDENNRVHSRTVDLNSDIYRVATSFMIK